MNLDQIKSTVFADFSEDITIASLDTLRQTLTGARHKHYARTVELADKYYKFITGEDHASLLKQYIKREDETMFKQRCDITQTITPAVLSKCMSPFHKVSRAAGITEIFDFAASESREAKKAKIDTALKEYNGDYSLSQYLDKYFANVSWADPNAYECTSFTDGKRDAQGNLISPVKPFPIRYSAKQVHNVYYINNVLQWLFVHESETVYLLYIKGYTMKYQVAKLEGYDNIEVGAYFELGETLYVKAAQNKFWSITVYANGSKRVPAKRVGYIPDLVTDGETCVSPMQPAVNLLMKTVKVVSELDITMANHAHPQKVQYVPRCSVSECHSGAMPDGKKCDRCNGTGYEPISTSAQDSIVLGMPKTPESSFTLSNLVHYVQFPIEVPKFQDEYIKGLTEQVMQAIYNSDVFNRTTIATTATEKIQSMDSVYDTLHPYAEQYSAVKKYLVENVANYVDVTDLIYTHKHPRDFRFRSRDELIAQLQAASNSGAPGYVKKGISAELTAAIFIDNPDHVKRISVKERLMPFSDKSETEIIGIIDDNHTPEKYKVLWTNFDQIFDDLEITQEEKAPEIYLYDIAITKIREMMWAKVDEMMAELPKQINAFPDIPANGNEGAGDNGNGGNDNSDNGE
jgi:hypothetical protein